MDYLGEAGIGRTRLDNEPGERLAVAQRELRRPGPVRFQEPQSYYRDVVLGPKPSRYWSIARFRRVAARRSATGAGRTNCRVDLARRGRQAHASRGLLQVRSGASGIERQGNRHRAADAAADRAFEVPTPQANCRPSASRAEGAPPRGCARPAQRKACVSTADRCQDPRGPQRPRLRDGRSRRRCRKCLYRCHQPPPQLAAGGDCRRTGCRRRPVAPDVPESFRQWPEHTAYRGQLPGNFASAGSGRQTDSPGRGRRSFSWRGNGSHQVVHDPFQ